MRIGSGRAIIALLLLILLLIGFFFLTYRKPASAYGLKKFSSCEELRNFIINQSFQSFGAFGMVVTGMHSFGVEGGELLSTFGAPAPKGVEYSETNVQVPGVDEPDIVKTDGTYIYSVGNDGNNGYVFITKAYPPEELGIVSNITLKNESIEELFLWNDKLVIFSQKILRYYRLGYPGLIPFYELPESYIRIYDISSRENPKLVKEISTTSGYVDSRIYEDHVYVITEEPVFSYSYGYEIQVPIIKIDGKEQPCACTDIYYVEEPDINYKFVTIFSINLKDNGIKKNVFLMGDAGIIYMSKGNIYITYGQTKGFLDILESYIRGVLEKVVPGEIKDEMEKILSNKEKTRSRRIAETIVLLREFFSNLSEEEKENLNEKMEKKAKEWYTNFTKEYFKTRIFKFSARGDNIEFVAGASVPGYIINQFSMDEHNGMLRIATTTRSPWLWSLGLLPSTQTENNVYILDEDLNLLGKLEGLEKNESIYGVRFIGDRGYIVTYRRIDPISVVDLSDPKNPKVLGVLKIPGYSNYLHPYDENHLIGIGMEIEEGGWRTSGVKISLFDVSDPTNPIEKAKYVINESWSSEALREHKAFLFDKSKNLLVIPVELEYYWREPTGFRQGAYVFNVSTSSITLKGRITHMQENWDYSRRIRRSLYIDDILYTISEKEIKSNALSDLHELGSVEFPIEEGYYYIWKGERQIPPLPVPFIPQGSGGAFQNSSLSQITA